MSNHTATYAEPSLSDFHTEPDVTGIIAILYTLLASLLELGDWTKYFILTSIFEALRKPMDSLWRFILDSFIFTVEFHENDDTYLWMMVWLSKQKSWSKTARSVHVSTRRLGHSGKVDRIEGENPGDEDEKKLLSMEPILNTTRYVWYKGTLLECTQYRKEFMEELWKHYGTGWLRIRTLRGGHKSLNALLLEAKKLYKTEFSERIDIYTIDPEKTEWVLAGTRPKRRMASVVLDSSVKERILRDAKDFLASEMWYAERGIPWRRGYLLYGCPGSGKTSLIHALAGELDLSIYILSLARLDDTKLDTLISRMPSKSIALIEDIDVAFFQGLSREDNNESVFGDSATKRTAAQMNDPTMTQKGPPPPTQSIGSSVSLAGLLAAIDGVAAQEGRILIASTNKYEALDPALRRPGRLDIHIKFEYATRWQVERLFQCFFPPHIAEEKAVIGKSASAQFESCRPASEAFDSGPKLSEDEVASLAKDFADKIPEKEFSMAAIQGHLMNFKARPHEAISEATAWVETERAARKERKFLMQEFQEFGTDDYDDAAEDDFDKPISIFRLMGTGLQSLFDMDIPFLSQAQASSPPFD